MTAVIRFADAVLQAATMSAREITTGWQLTRNHNQQLHQVIVDIRRTRRLENEHIFVPYRRMYLDASLEREKLGDVTWREGDSESVKASVDDAIERIGGIQFRG